MADFIVKVPRTPKSAFNKSRKPSDLLLTQIEHLRHVAHRHPGCDESLLSGKKPRTEAQVASLIAKVMRDLHPECAPPAPPPAAPTRVSSPGGRKPAGRKKR